MSDDPSVVVASYTVLVFLQGVGNILAGQISSGLLFEKINLSTYGIGRYEILVIFTRLCMFSSAIVTGLWYLMPKKMRWHNLVEPFWDDGSLSGHPISTALSGNRKTPHVAHHSKSALTASSSSGGCKAEAQALPLSGCYGKASELSLPQSSETTQPDAKYESLIYKMSLSFGSAKGYAPYLSCWPI